jgi:hypothetical protein
MLSVHIERILHIFGRKANFIYCVSSICCILDTILHNGKVTGKDVSAF